MERLIISSDWLTIYVLRVILPRWWRVFELSCSMAIVYFQCGVSLWRQDFCESIPIVSIEKTIIQCSCLQYNLLTRRNITTSNNTCGSSPCVTRSRALMIHFFLNAGNATFCWFRYSLLLLKQQVLRVFLWSCWSIDKDTMEKHQRVLLKIGSLPYPESKKHKFGASTRLQGWWESLR